MFLRELTLENVRCFERLTVDFADGSNAEDVRKWTIVLGENGTGKSTILRAAGLVTGGSDALTDLLGDPRYWIRQGADACAIRAVLQTADGEHRTVSLAIRRDQGPSSVIADSRETLGPLNDALEHTSRSYFVAGYGASRRMGTSTSRVRPHSRYDHVRAQSLATLFDADASLAALESWAMDLDYRKEQSGIETVRKVLSNFLPGLTFHGIDKEAGALLFDTPDGVVPLRYLSDGYQNVAGWVGDLLHRIASAFDDYREPLKTRGLLLIDEIDLHLHPTWQRSLLAFLDRQLPNMQLLVTTHSPVTAQQADPRALHYLKRRGKRVALHHFDADPGRLLIHQLLMSDAFGLQTDESLAVEKKKKRYRTLRDASSRTPAQERELDRLKSELKDIAQSGADNMVLHEEQVELMRRIQAELDPGR